MSNKQYPVGKAQSTVLNALGIKVNGFADAEKEFAKLGIVVVAKRQGRSSIPQITIKSRTSGAVNTSGEGESWTEYPELTDAQMTAISQWVK